MKGRVEITIKDHVADVKLVRSDKMNAIDAKMFDALIDTAALIEKDGNIRSVVISGEGKAFCAGLDVSNFAPDTQVNSEPLVTRTHGVANKFQKAAYAWRELSVPVIAGVHGVAFGGGLQICLGADVRYVRPDTKLSIMEVKWGLVPDMSSTQIMRHLVREDIIKELSYTGRVFSGEEAVSYGFCTHVSETPYEDAMKLAKEIASKSPSAIQGMKTLLNAAPNLSPEEGLLLESELQDDIIGKKNQMEAIFSTMQKRTGNYEKAR